MDQEIAIKEASIHFIYSFLPVMNHVALSKDDLKRLSQCMSKIHECKGDLGKPKNRIGISAYMALDLDMAFLRFPELKGKLENINIRIEPTIRMFPLGSICCLSIHTYEKGVTLDDVHKLLHLISQKENRKTGYQITDIDDGRYRFKETTLFGLFKYIVDQIEVSFNETLLCEEKKLRLLCKEYVDKHVDEYQCPWVISVLELTGPAHDAFCGSFSSAEDPFVAKREAIRQYEKDIAPILYRSATGRDFPVDPAYPDPLSSYSRVGIFNMNVDARLFVHMSRRSILCMCGDQDTEPAQYFLPVLLDLCEMVQSRSNVLIILNKLLDESLKNFVTGKTDPKQRLNSIIELINKFMLCLEDPSSYVISGDALREIQEKLVDVLRVKGLTDVVLKKIDMLERLYKYGLEMRWAERA